jgi:FkbM family methyltransferase
MPRLKERVRKLLPRRERSHAIKGGELKGERIFTSWHDYPGAILGTTERPLLDWFARNVRPGETWLDIGAHYGYTAIALSRLVGPAGRVYAFEPVLATAGCLARTRELNGLNQLTVVPMALHRLPEITTLDLPVIRGMADSTISRDSLSERILAVSLDSIWPSLCSGNPKVQGVKIDVQGMELAVLSGMTELLDRCSPRLVIEFHRGVDRGEILRLLENHGYSARWRPIDPGSASDVLADDMSYAFEAEPAACESSFTPSFTARN